MKIEWGYSCNVCLCRTCSKYRYRNIYDDRCRCKKADEILGLNCANDEFIAKCDEYEVDESDE